MSVYLPLNEEDKKFFYDVLDYDGTSYFRGFKKLNAQGEIIAMMGYDDWTKNSVQFHIWSRNPKAIDRQFLREAFGYPFCQVGVNLAIGITPCNNEAALKFNLGVGFKRTYTIKDGYDIGVDLAVQEMRKEDCPWINGRKWNGRKASRYSSTTQLSTDSPTADSTESAVARSANGRESS
jgi:hypothetical protein